jgi:hypothetical protein
MRRQSGTMTFHRQAGDEVYRLKSAVLSVSRTKGGYELVFGVDAKKGAVKTTPDTAQSPKTPNAEVFVTVKHFDPEKLVGRKFSVPKAYDEEQEDHVATLCYYEHQDLNGNVVEILARDGEYYQVRWRATTCDVNYYDGSAPENRIEIEGWFKYEGIRE